MEVHASNLSAREVQAGAQEALTFVQNKGWL